MTRTLELLSPLRLLAMHRSLGVCAVVLSFGCQVDLGSCDEGLARTVVYDEGGFPAYEGQAMTQVSCGNGAFCHSEGALGAERRGAPAGLDFDVALATFGDSPAEESTARLGRDRDTLLRHAGTAYCLVESGDMPPFGDATADVFEFNPRYFREDGSRVPSIDSVTGIRRFQNWLACDAPIVERVSGTGTVGDVVPVRPMP